MLTGIFADRPEDYPDDGPIDPTAIFYSKWADRKKAAALDCLDGPEAFALDLELMLLHKRMNEESNEDCFRVLAYNTECAEVCSRRSDMGDVTALLVRASRVRSNFLSRYKPRADCSS